jgi:hypothetical protein
MQTGEPLCKASRNSRLSFFHHLLPFTQGWASEHPKSLSILWQEVEASLILLKNQGVTENGNESVTETWTHHRPKPVHLLSLSELGTETIP